MFFALKLEINQLKEALKQMCAKAFIP